MTSMSSSCMTYSPSPSRRSVVLPGGGDGACQAVGWAGAGVVDGDHGAARCGPDAHRRGRAAVALCVAEGLG